ncbi:hypothetical protein PTKIN_Ptkin08bG0066200 [Pterospermum kingtungense]
MDAFDSKVDGEGSIHGKDRNQLGWALEVAAELEIPRVAFHPASAFILALLFSTKKLPDDQVIDENGAKTKLKYYKSRVANLQHHIRTGASSTKLSSRDSAHRPSFSNQPAWGHGRKFLAKGCYLFEMA